jgi:hypothetical protein
MVRGGTLGEHLRSGPSHQICRKLTGLGTFGPYAWVRQSHTIFESGTLRRLRVTCVEELT